MRSVARNPEALVQLIKKKPATRLVGLKPFAVNDQLRNGALAYIAQNFSRGSGIGIHIDLGVAYAVRFKKLLGCAAVPAP